MVVVEVNGWEMIVPKETANDPIKLARVIAVLQQLS